MAPLDVKRTLGTRHFARLRQIGPDFTIADHARGVTYFLLRTSRHARRPGVQSRWERKRVEYLESGIGPHADGGDPEGTLIETRDEPRGGLDAAVIASGIDRVILRDA